MAVAFDAKGTASQHNTVSVTSFTYTGLTVGPLNNTVLAVTLAFGANVSAVSAHWDSAGTNQAMTQIVTANATTNNAYVFIAGLIAPTTGNKTLSVSWTTSSDYCVDAVSFTGADQSAIGTTFKNTTSTAVTASSTPSQLPITITSPTNDMAIAAWASSPVAWDATGITGTNIFVDTTAVSAAADYISGSGTTVSPSIRATDITSGGQWVAVGCDIAA